MNIDSKQNFANESFSSKSKASKPCIQNTRMCLLCVTIVRREIIMRIKVCHILWINFDSKENGRKKALLANPKHQYHVSQCGQRDYHGSNKKNGDYF